MTTTEIAGEAVTAHLERVGGMLRVKGKLRRIPPALRPYVAESLKGQTVQVLDRHGRTYLGLLVVVARTTDGNVSHTLTLDPGGNLWPVALSLATIDELTEVPF